MDIVQSYINVVIKPIEEARNNIRACYYSKSIFKYLNRKVYKEYLDKYDKLLLEKCEILAQIISDFNN